MVFEDVIKLRIFRWGGYPGLVVRAGNVKYLYKVEAERDFMHTDKIEVIGKTAAKIGIMWPQVKEGWQPPKAGRGKTQLPHQSLWRECCLANVLISSQ